MVLLEILTSWQLFPFLVQSPTHRHGRHLPLTLLVHLAFIFLVFFLSSRCDPPWFFFIPVLFVCPVSYSSLSFPSQLADGIPKWVVTFYNYAPQAFIKSVGFCTSSLLSHTFFLPIVVHSFSFSAFFVSPSMSGGSFRWRDGGLLFFCNDGFPFVWVSPAFFRHCVSTPFPFCRNLHNAFLEWEHLVRQQSSFQP